MRSRETQKENEQCPDTDNRDHCRENQMVKLGFKGTCVSVYETFYAQVGCIVTCTQHMTMAMTYITSGESDRQSKFVREQREKGDPAKNNE